VDVAVILGPSTPPTLSVQIVKWMADPDLAMRLTGAAAALVQAGLVLGVLILWWIGERVVGALGRRWIYAGHRGRFDPIARGAALGVGALSAAAIIFGLAGLLVWSFAAFWSFPDILPEGFTLRSWIRHGPDAMATLGETFVIAGVAVVIALALVLGCLEAEHRTVDG